MDSGRSYASEKSSLTHLFKLNGLAKLYVRTGEVMVFPTLAQRSQWPLAEKDILLFAKLGSAISTKVLAEQVQRNQDRVRHDLSEHVYQFLEEVTDREVHNRLAAFQLLLELGILEYVPCY